MIFPGVVVTDPLGLDTVVFEMPVRLAEDSESVPLLVPLGRLREGVEKTMLVTGKPLEVITVTL